MKFVAKEDISLPQEDLFAAVTDYASFERQALRRGAKVTRLDSKAVAGVGMAWKIVFAFRGRERELDAEIAQFQEPDSYSVDGRIAGLNGRFQLDLISLSRSQTRLTCALELVPKSLTARVLVQSMKLSRSTLQARFEKRVASFAKDLEARS